ncbi:MAG TPA: type II toxin-antitoxin system VapC family toxin [Acidobacteriaceae bacterium]|jgi:predicted nucleic-acid-binding protein|nr:type II toxin-antitoxin system VapC family toxin [Acidobacteriaceae bacterium]
MLAVDTNVVVRYLARDHGSQTERAEELIRREQLLIPKTVLLEAEWVLRYSYGFDRRSIEAALRGLVGLPNIHLEDAEAVAQALDWFRVGIDFADALHLASSAGTDGFATFDRRLAATAQRVGAHGVRQLR